MDKKQLRKQFRQLRKAGFSMEKSEIIEQKISDSEEYRLCKSIFVYVSYNTEVDTFKIINKALSDKKTVAVPVMTDIPHTMVFVKIDSMACLEKNSFGILEPTLKEENIVNADENTLVIVPALAFDRCGYRLGYGGGYYDKYLSENKTLCNVGIGFECQLVDRLEINEYDVKLDKIITEEENV